MKTRETKQKDLTAITESLANSKSAMVVSFTGLSVQKDQEFRNSLREAGAQYQVVKNTLARIAWTENDPVVLSKAISKFMKDNADTYTFKTGVVDGKLVDFTQLNTIASLPSKEELISKLLFVLNAQAQRIVTVINAVPRDLAVVIKQIGDQPDRAAGTPKAEEAPAEEVAPEAVASDDTAPAEVAAPEAPAEASATEAESEAAANAPDDAAEAAVDTAPAEEPAAE